MTKIKVGIVGTGYTAKRRAEALQQDERGSLKFVTGHSPENLAFFAKLIKLKASIPGKS